jgi:protein TonB
MTRSSSQQQDPLVHEDAGTAKQIGTFAAILGAAVVAHAFAMGGISLASRLAKSNDDGTVFERVAMEVIEVEPEPVIEPEPLPEEQPQPEIEEPEAVEATPAPKPAKPKARVAAAPPPSDRIEHAKPEPAKPIRRTIGLSLESTVNGGDGPAFNTGNSRMGRTSTTANDQNRIDRRAPTPIAHHAPPPGPNRAAAHIPGSKTKLVRPKRVSRVTPQYPAVLRAQNIEGTVVLRVHIDKSGRVTNVNIVAKASHDEFNKAARIAALKERFKPATKNGVAVPYDITFSSRFRLDEV